MKATLKVWPAYSKALSPSLLKSWIQTPTTTTAPEATTTKRQTFCWYWIALTKVSTMDSSRGNKSVTCASSATESSKAYEPSIVLYGSQNCTTTVTKRRIQIVDLSSHTCHLVMSVCDLGVWKKANLWEPPRISSSGWKLWITTIWFGCSCNSCNSISTQSVVPLVCSCHSMVNQLWKDVAKFKATTTTASA